MGENKGCAGKKTAVRRGLVRRSSDGEVDSVFVPGRYRVYGGRITSIQRMYALESGSH